MRFLETKAADGGHKGKMALYCRLLGVSRQGFAKHLRAKGRPWKHEALAAEIMGILCEDECNDRYGRQRIREALEQRHPGEAIPSLRTICRAMQKLGISRERKRKPNGITKADRVARKPDDLLKRDFHADEPFKKCITDITQMEAKDGTIYVSAIFDCFNLAELGLAMDTNMRATLCVKTLADARRKFPGLRGAIIHSDRGSQYTSEEYRKALGRHGIIQSMNSASGRCHDNARCESMWARLKEELIYGRYNTKEMTVAELKALIWRYYESYWNNRRICSANGGLPPMVKLERYYDSQKAVA